MKLPNVPVVAGEIGEWRNIEKTKSFNENLHKLPEMLNDCYVVRADSCNHIGDSLHFNRNALIILGKRYAEVIYTIKCAKIVTK